MTKKMICITSPHFVVGLSLYQGFVDRMPPIVKYMHGWEAFRVEAYCKSKGWIYELIDQ